MAAALQGALPIIGVGSILNGADSVENAGWRVAGAGLERADLSRHGFGGGMCGSDQEHALICRETAGLSPAQRIQQG